MTLPNDEHPPTSFLELLDVLLVTADVFLKLHFPEFGIALWIGRFGAAEMLMPEAPMNKYHRVVLRENDIRFTRQIFTMKTKSVTHPMQRAPNPLFGFGILRPHSPHNLAAFSRGVYVRRHRLSSSFCILGLQRAVK